jgi:ribonuclease HI
MNQILKQIMYNPIANKVSIWTDGSFHDLYGVGACAILVQCWDKSSIKLYECYYSYVIPTCLSCVEAEIKGVAAAIDLVIKYVKRRCCIKNVSIFTDSKEGLEHFRYKLAHIKKRLPVTTVVSGKKVKSRRHYGNKVVDFIARTQMRQNLPLGASTRIESKSSKKKRLRSIFKSSVSSRELIIRKNIRDFSRISTSLEGTLSKSDKKFDFWKPLDGGPELFLN